MFLTMPDTSFNSRTNFVICLTWLCSPWSTAAKILQLSEPEVSPAFSYPKFAINIVFFSFSHLMAPIRQASCINPSLTLSITNFGVSYVVSERVKQLLHSFTEYIPWLQFSQAGYVVHRTLWVSITMSWFTPRAQSKHIRPSETSVLRGSAPRVTRTHQTCRSYLDSDLGAWRFGKHFIVVGTAGTRRCW